MVEHTPSIQHLVLLAVARNTIVVVILVERYYHMGEICLPSVIDDLIRNILVCRDCHMMWRIHQARQKQSFSKGVCISWKEKMWADRCHRLAPRLDGVFVSDACRGQGDANGVNHHSLSGFVEVWLMIRNGWSSFSKVLALDFTVTMLV